MTSWSFTRRALALLGCVILLRVSLPLSGEPASPAPQEAIRTLLDSGRFAEAETAARAHLESTEGSTASDPIAVADALDLLVEARWRSGKSGEEETPALGRRAIRIREEAQPGTFALGKSIAILGNVLASREELKEARAALERALSIQEAALGPESARLIGAMNTLGIVLRRMGDLAGARDVLGRTLALAEKTIGPESDPVARVLGSLGSTLSIMGDHTAALPYFERSLAIMEKVHGPDHPFVAQSLNNVGTELLEQGDLAAAETFLERAVAVNEAALGPDHPEVALNLHNLANVKGDRGDLEEARALYERCLAIQRETLGSEHAEVAATLGNLGFTLSELGDLDAARDRLEESIRIRETTLEPDHHELAWSLFRLADVLRQSGEDDVAWPLLEKAGRIIEASLGAAHPNMGWVLLYSARLARDEGDAARARAFADRARRIWEEAFGPAHWYVSEALDEMARADWGLRSFEAMLDDALRAEAIGHEHLRAVARTLSEREALRLAALRNGGLDLPLSFLASGEEATALPAARAIWDALIRRRAVVLDEMARRHGAVSGLETPEARDFARSLGDARRRAAYLMTRTVVGRDSGAYAQELRSALADKERLERRLAEVSAAFRDERAENTAGLPEVVAALPARSALIAYVQYERRLPASGEAGATGDKRRSYAAFLLTSANAAPQAIPLGGAAEIDALVREWKTEVGAPPRSAEAVDRYRRTGERLRQAIWDPIARRLHGATRVFIVPDGAFHNLSLATLPVGDDGYLVESGPLAHYLSAERDLVRLARPPQRGRGLLLIGGPDFETRPAIPSAVAPGPPEGAARAPAVASEPPDPTTSTIRGPCESPGGIRFAALPGAEAEAAEVESLWKKRSRGSAPGDGDVLTLVGRQASEAAFKSSAPGRRVLHLATHGYFLDGRCGRAMPDGGSPPTDARSSDPGLVSGASPLLLSGLALAGANRTQRKSGEGEEDGLLTAEEIASLDLRGVEWVILSACETGLGPILSGEGVLGMRRTFQVAGARTLIMSLWEVQDQATRDWIRHLYRGRLEGLGTAEAARQAALNVIRARRRAGVTAHPFYWGAFVAAGDWR